MSGIDFLRLCAEVRSRLDGARHRHSVCVARMAERLALRYGVSRAQARLAGMLHDLARLWRADDLLAYAAGHDMPVSDEERTAPVLLHAAIGAELARTEFGVSDPDVMGAIARHTVARPGMTDLEKVVYIADTIEPTRTFSERPALEAAAFRSLDEGLLACVGASIRYLSARRLRASQETVQLYEELVQRAGAS